MIIAAKHIHNINQYRARLSSHNNITMMIGCLVLVINIVCVAAIIFGDMVKIQSILYIILSMVSIYVFSIMVYLCHVFLVNMMVTEIITEYAIDTKLVYHGDWRFIISQQYSPTLTDQCGSPYYTLDGNMVTLPQYIDYVPQYLK